MKIVADDAVPFLDGVLDSWADVIRLPGSKITRDDLLDADAMIIRTRTKCNAKLLEGTEVRLIASATIGMDHMDLSACERLGIRCVNAPGCNAQSVAQYIVSVLVTDSLKTGHPLAGKTIGIIGAGHVGTKVSAAASALGMRILLNDPPRERKEGPGKFVSLDHLLQESDYVTLHTPLNRDFPDRTFHLAGEDFFMKMKKHPYFINASRGPVTDQNALKSALITGQVRAAALDVWEDEPDVEDELLSMVSVATPHIAGYSADGKAAGTAMAVRAVAEYFHIGPLKDFYPQNVPQPEQPMIRVSPARAVEDAVLASYDVLTDDAALRQAPEQFEALRARYPVRREFSAYRIGNAEKLPFPAVKTLRALGFGGC